jgi:hypothetical protein
MRHRLLCTLAGAMLLGAPAAATAEPGSPNQLAPPNACLADSALSGCAADPFGSFGGPVEVAVAPGGGHVYVANGTNGRLGIFARDAATNALTGLGYTDPVDADTVRISADGAIVLMAGGSTNGEGSIQTFTRNPGTGALAELSCANEDLVKGCANLAGIGGAADVALPPSGAGLYVAGGYAGGDGADGGTAPDGALAALSFNPSTGAFAQLNCMPATSDVACAGTAQPVVAGIEAAIVSPDGRHIYSGGFNGIGGWNRNEATGTLSSQVTCLYRVTAQGSCKEEDRLGVITQLAITPDGEWLLAGGSNGLAVLDRQPLSGALSVATCFKRSGTAGPCPVLDGFAGAVGAAVRGDAKTVYLVGAGIGAAGELRAFHLDAATGGLTPFACVSVLAGPACTPGAGLLNAQDVALSDDGRGLYTVANEGTGEAASGALSAFSIEQPPSAGGGGSPPPGPSGGGPSPGAALPPDITRPSSRIGRIPRTVGAADLKRFRGTASDTGGASVARVELSLIRLDGAARSAAKAKPKARCRVLSGRGKLGKRPARRGRCRAQGFLRAKGTTSWSFTLKRELSPGRYVLYTRAVDTAGNREQDFTAKKGNLRTFTVE